MVCAMDSEAVHLRRKLASVVEEPSPVPGYWRVSRGKLHGVDVRLLICNIGIANAASSTAAVLSGGWRPRYVLNYGCSGAHGAAIREGDVVRVAPATPLYTEALP